MYRGYLVKNALKDNDPGTLSVRKPQQALLQHMLTMFVFHLHQGHLEEILNPECGVLPNHTNMDHHRLIQLWRRLD